MLGGERLMKREEGFTMIELILVTAIIGIISAIAIPNLLNAKKVAYESSAIRYLRTWAPGQEMYKKAHGYYSATDEVLVQEKFINKALDSSGSADDTAFSYSMDSSSTNPDGTPNTTLWYGRARRISPVYAKRSFYVDQSGVIRAAQGDTCTVADPPIE